MKLLLVSALLLGISHISQAQRDTSLRVVDALRQVQPAYRELQNFVVNAVSSAKLNSSDVVFTFNVEVASAKDSFLRSAITAEMGMLQQINGQAPSVDNSCLAFLRQSVDVNMNLAGVSFTNCINNVDTSLAQEVNRIYAELQVNETSFLNISIYDVFRGQNIFVNPQTIIDRLQEKLTALQQTPTGLVGELAQQVSAFAGRLEVVRLAYSQCLTMNDQLLQSTFNNALLQLQQICLGELLPSTSTQSDEITESESDSPVQTETTDGTVPTSPPVTEAPTETEAPAETEVSTEAPTEVPTEASTEATSDVPENAEDESTRPAPPSPEPTNARFARASRII